jgi:hypothetical protein
MSKSCSRLLGIPADGNHVYSSAFRVGEILLSRRCTLHQVVSVNRLTAPMVRPLVMAPPGPPQIYPFEVGRSDGRRGLLPAYS